MQRYTEGKSSASEGRVLVTEWFGKAWTCSISLTLDGSKNREIHIESIEAYKLPTANDITESELDGESEIEDEEDNFEVTDSYSSSKSESCD